MKKITAVLLGAGGRGRYAYGQYAVKHADEIQFIAVAEPNAERREIFSNIHNIPKENCFANWDELLSKPRFADAILICTLDQMHFEPTLKAMELGYHILLEKPISNDPYECVTIGEYAKKYDKTFAVCHVLRYTMFFRKIKQLLNEQKIGRLISIQHNENIAFWHFSHSFVRGNFRNSAESSPVILAKCCHDMDILLWLADSKCKRISSFGSLTHFKTENAPDGAPLRCLDGCPASRECEFYAPRLYLSEDAGWIADAISTDTSTEARTNALKTGPYGRCVYRCDNDVCDHQVVNIEFENEVTASFTMSAFTQDCSRTIKLMGTKGEIRGHMEDDEIEILDFLTGSKEVIRLNAPKIGHSGGDEGIMDDFIGLIRSDTSAESLTSAAASVESHIMAFAAEKSRIEKKVIEMDEYIEFLKG